MNLNSCHWKELRTEMLSHASKVVSDESMLLNISDLETNKNKIPFQCHWKLLPGNCHRLMWVMSTASPESSKLDRTDTICLIQPSELCVLGFLFNMFIVSLQETSLTIQFQKLNCIFYPRYCMIGMTTNAGNYWQKSIMLANLVGVSCWRTRVSYVEHVSLDAHFFDRFSV